MEMYKIYTCEKGSLTLVLSNILAGWIMIICVTLIALKYVTLDYITWTSTDDFFLTSKRNLFTFHTRIYTQDATKLYTLKLLNHHIFVRKTEKLHQITCIIIYVNLIVYVKF